jgi:ABC-type Na+ efflux pump permease subunit
MLKNSLFIARKDVQYLLKDRSTMVWLFIMPVVFFYFIGTLTGGFGGGAFGLQPVELAIQMPAQPGYITSQLMLRLEESGFDVIPFTTVEAIDSPSEFDSYEYRLMIPEDFEEALQNGESRALIFARDEEDLAGNLQNVRINRAGYTLLADMLASIELSGELSESSIFELNNTPRKVTLRVEAAGERQKIPTGFEQSIPGIMVMFTLLVLLTSGATLLVLEREKGLLRRLAYSPLTKGEIVLGKWGGKIALGLIQILFGLVLGTLLFQMNWGPDFPMVILVLFAWGAFCASFGILLGSLGKSEGQVAGLGVMASMILAALGGAWWPIEITPDWMQSIQKLLPSGWAMDAMHKLISFESGAVSVLPHVGLLIAAAIVLGLIGVRKFRFQ